MNTTTKPKVTEQSPSQYDIWYKGMIIESTGYLPTLEAAKKFVRARYGSNGIQVQACYPTRSDVKHNV